MVIIPRRAAAIIQAADAGTEYPYAPNAVRVREFSGSWWVEATDARILAVARGPAVESQIPPPEMEGEAVFDYLVPLAAWKAAWKGKDEAVGFCSDGKLVYICTPNGGLDTCPVVEGRFPNTDRLMTTTGPALLSARVNPHYLKVLAAMAGAFVADQESSAVSVGMAPGEGPLLFLARAGGDLLEGLLMPLQPDQQARPPQPAPPAAPPRISPPQEPKVYTPPEPAADPETNGHAPQKKGDDMKEVRRAAGQDSPPARESRAPR